MNEWLSVVAGAITSITVIGTFLVMLVKKTIVTPMEKRKVERDKKIEKDRQEFEQQLLKRVEQNQQPLTLSIAQLNVLLEESQRDRTALHQIADNNVKVIGQHEERLDNHNDRLIVLETKNGVRTYTEVYKEDK